MRRSLINRIFIAVRGSIFEEIKMDLGNFEVRNLQREDGILSFEARIAIGEDDKTGKIVKAEILEDDLLVLIVDGVAVFPISENFKEEF